MKRQLGVFLRVMTAPNSDDIQYRPPEAEAPVQPADATPPAVAAGGARQSDPAKAVASNIRSWGTAVVTVLVFIAFFWVLYFVLHNIGSKPSKAPTGDIIDRFARSKDILTVVLSLTTAAIGYWFGNDGKAQAQNQAVNAQNTAAAAQTQASKAQDTATKAQTDAATAHAHAAAVEKQKSAILAVAQNDLLTLAKQAHPEAFS